ncbi:hypothetical protein ABIB75_002924 [Bradyrhizobium sp. GM2.2]
MALALVGIADAENELGWSNDAIPSEHAIRRLQGVTLLLGSAEKTAAILTDVFDFREAAPCPCIGKVLASTIGSACGICRAPQECADLRCLNSAAWTFTKSRMFVGAAPVSLYMASVMRS